MGILRDICGLKNYFIDRQADGSLDNTDRWLCLVAMNRLTGQSSGFFSVRTLPPNQAVSPKSQLKVNAKNNQTPPRRDVREVILEKPRHLPRAVVAWFGVVVEGTYFSDN